MGVLPSERGKKGFTEARLAATKGFAESNVHSEEMVEKKAFDGEEQQSKVDKFLTYFQPYVFVDSMASPQEPAFNTVTVAHEDADGLLE